MWYGASSPPWFSGDVAFTYPTHVSVANARAHQDAGRPVTARLLNDQLGV